MKRPSILDVLCAVKRVARAYSDVSGWWYAPTRRLRLEGDRPDLAEPGAVVDLFVQGPVGPADAERIARELSRHLGGASVRVRPYEGAAEQAPVVDHVAAESQTSRRLFRLVTGSTAANAGHRTAGCRGER